MFGEIKNPWLVNSMNSFPWWWYPTGQASTKTFMQGTQVFPEHHTGEAIAKEPKCITRSYSARERRWLAVDMDLCYKILSKKGRMGKNIQLCSLPAVMPERKPQHCCNWSTTQCSQKASRALSSQCGGNRHIWEIARANGWPPEADAGCILCGYTMQFFFTYAWASRPDVWLQ